jgi:hypothetical protein
MLQTGDSLRKLSVLRFCGTLKILHELGFTVQLTENALIFHYGFCGKRMCNGAWQDQVVSWISCQHSYQAFKGTYEQW